MKIKSYVCKCGSDDFLLVKTKRNPHTGIYCKKCYEWLKWADKDEKKLLKIKEYKIDEE